MKRTTIDRAALALALLLCLAPVVGAGRATAAAPDAAPGVPSGPTTAELIAAAPDQAAYPDDDAIVLLERTDWEIGPDGGVALRVRRVTRVFTEWAVRRLSDVRVRWDARRQEISVPVCRTFMRDGREVATPRRGLNEVTPDGVAHCAGLASLREMVISHVGVERGAVLELVYEIRDEAPGPLGPGAATYLRGDLPVLRREVVVTAPAGMDLVHASLGGAPDAAVAVGPGGEQVLTWTAVDLPPLPADGGYAPAERLPAALFSDRASWPGLGAELADLSATATAPDPELAAWLRRAGEEPGGGEAEEAALALPADAGAPEALVTVEHVARLVGDRLRPAGPPEPWLRAPRPPREVLRSGCGTGWERMALASALLRAGGLEPDLVFPCRRSTWTEGVAAADLLDAPWVRVAAAGRERWLSAGSGRPRVAPDELAGRPLLVLGGDGEVRLETAAPAPEASCALAASLAPRGGSGGDDEGGEDDAQPAAWSLSLDCVAAGSCRGDDGDEEPQDLARRLARGLLADPEVVSVELLERSPEQVHLRATLKGDLAGHRDGRAVLSLPAGPVDLTDLLPRGLSLQDPERELPLRLARPVRLEVDLTLELPDGAAAEHLPAAADLALAGATYRQEVALRDGRLRLRRTVALPAGEIRPAAWPDLRRLLVTTLEPAAGSLVLALP